jgi:hypothetical protein
MQPSCEHGRYSRLLGTGHFHDDHNGARKSLPPRAVICSPARALLCIVPGIPSYRCDHVTARTSDPVPFVSTPIMCAGDRAKTSSPRGPKSLPPTCWSRRTPSGSSARLTSSARTGPPNDLVLRSWIDSSDLMAIPAKVPGQSPQLGFSMVIGRQRTETPYLLQNPNSVHRFQEHPPWIASPRASVECRDLSKGASGSPDRALAGTSISQGRPAGAAECHERSKTTP